LTVVEIHLMLAERSHMCQLCCKIGSPKQLVEKVIFFSDPFMGQQEQNIIRRPA